jgi:peptide/nickel transport system ATP-binding protein
VPDAAKTPVLELEHVSVVYDSDHGPVYAVRDVNLSVGQDEIVGLIGESGSGKTTLAYAIMHLLRGNARLAQGSIRVCGEDVYRMTAAQLRVFRWERMSMVFQSAMNALNPVLTVERQLIDTLQSHRTGLARAEASRRAAELLDWVRIDRRHLRSFPHELSGGMRQRVVIAIAIALEPQLVIMDEPTTALDVVVQRSILDQIQEIQNRIHCSVLFVSHDVSLVAELASRVAIMYAGRIVELTTSDALTDGGEHHPYTHGLLRAIPRLSAEDVTIDGIPGSPPDLMRLPAGCAFEPRCPEAREVCKVSRPSRATSPGGEIECHLFPTV